MKRKNPIERPQPTRVDWSEVVAQLKENPGVWFMVGVFAPATATYLRAGRNAAFVPEGTGSPREYMATHYEITAQQATKVPDRRELYIRWLG